MTDLERAEPAFASLLDAHFQSPDRAGSLQLGAALTEQVAKLGLIGAPARSRVRKLRRRVCSGGKGQREPGAQRQDFVSGLHDQLMTSASLRDHEIQGAAIVRGVVPSLPRWRAGGGRSEQAGFWR